MCLNFCALIYSEDDVEVKRTVNRASSTNKNNAGWYFPDSKRFNFVGDNGLKKENEDLNEESSFMNSFENNQQALTTPRPLQNQNQNGLAIIKARRDQIVANSSNLKSKFNLGPRQNVKLMRNKSAVNNRLDSLDWKKHATEAGIRIEYQGTTEHAYHYTKPQKEEYRNFVLNPQVDMTKSGLRPFTIAQFYPVGTEYSDHFKYPDHTKIDKFPWIKKF